MVETLKELSAVIDHIDVAGHERELLMYTEDLSRNSQES